MTRIASSLFLLICLSATPICVAADQLLVVDIWPGKVPGDVGIAGDEHFIELKVNGKPYQVPGKRAGGLLIVGESSKAGITNGL